MSSTEHTEIRAQLEAIRDKRERFKQLRAEADEAAHTAIPAAIDAGLSISEIAELAGYTRASVYQRFVDRPSR